MPHRFPALLAAPPAAKGRLLLVNARVFDGERLLPEAHGRLLIEDGVIIDVGSDDLSPSEGALVLDVGGRTVMPGLINCHVHVWPRLPTPLRGEEPMLEGTAAHFIQDGLRETLRMGVTTLRDVGSQEGQAQEARQAMRRGAFRGPRLLTCAKIISSTAPGGRFYGTMYREADGPDDIRRAVREQIRWGADFVKVMATGARSNELEDPEPTQFTDAEFAALVDEAHRLGYKVCAHAEGHDGVAAAIRHGMDTIEHGMYLNQREDLLEKMVQGGQFLVPTLTGYYFMAGLGEDVVDPADGVPAPQMGAMLVELARHNLEEGTKTMRMAQAAGVKVALGSDGHTEPKGTAFELVRMVHHGLSSTEALTAATKTAAEALGLAAELGTVERGKLADLLVVDGDPAVDPALLTRRERIWLVLQLGAPVAGQALEQEVGRLFEAKASEEAL